MTESDHTGMSRSALEQKLTKKMGQLIGKFNLIENGDRIMVCISGGKDSYAMLSLLHLMKQRANAEFDLIAVHLDQGHPGYDGSLLEKHLSDHDYRFEIVRENTYQVVQEKLAPGATTCSLCSRLRRGILYNTAQRLGCNKIALGHHREDAVETLLLNMVYAGSLGAMPPLLRSKDGRNTVIRPLLSCPESYLAEYAVQMGYPIIPCDLCGSQENLKRKRIKQLLADLELTAPDAKESLFASLGHVKRTHLMDPTLTNYLDEEEADLVSARASDIQPSAAAELQGRSGLPSSGPTSALRLPVL